MIFLNHIIMTILFLVPLNPISSLYLNYVDQYMKYGFSQNWNLFGSSLRRTSASLQYRCLDEAWLTFGSGSLNAHYSNRLIGQGKAYYMYNHFFKDLVENYSKSEFRISDSIYALGDNPLYKLNSFNVISNLIKIRCKEKFQIRLVIIKQRNISEKEKSKLSYTVIPFFTSRFIQVK